MFFCLAMYEYRTSFFFSSRRRHTSSLRDWSSDVCSSDLRPGVILSYDRNDATLNELTSAGFRVIEEDETLKEGGRAVIAIEGSELVRGGGGPRCMTLPLRRDDL